MKNQVSKLIKTKYWPVPDSYSKSIPNKFSPGAFWEDRGDRFHCGIDIYAPAGSKVISVDNGIVLETGIFTTPKKVNYWNVTKYVIIKNQDGFYCKYAELEDIVVKEEESVRAGQFIGIIGTVLNLKKITNNSPAYIQEIKRNNNQSMLHFELYDSKPFEYKNYLGGNWFGIKKPKNLLNPEDKFKNFFRKDI